MFEVDLQLFGGGGSKSGLGGGKGSGPFGGMEVKPNENKKLVYGFVYRGKDGKYREGTIIARTEGNAEEQLKERGIRYSEKTLMTKNFFDKAMGLAKENGGKVDWKKAKDAYRKAYKRYLG